MFINVVIKFRIKLHEHYLQRHAKFMDDDTMRINLLIQYGQGTTDEAKTEQNKCNVTDHKQMKSSGKNCTVAT